jgi:hypothetical protein
MPRLARIPVQEESAVSKWCAFDLFVSKDFGRHWTNLTTASGGRVASFWDFDWGANVARWQRRELGFKDETGASLGRVCTGSGPSEGKASMPASVLLRPGGFIYLSLLEA